MYKQYFNYDRSINNYAVLNENNLCIPFDPANTDYQTFKRDVAEGVELQDADGNVMTQDQVTAFLATLP